MVRARSLVFVVLALLAGAVLACGGDSSTDGDAQTGSAFQELGKITAIQPARPVLVFVYTDG